MLFTFQHSSVWKTLQMIKIMFYMSFMDFGACMPKAQKLLSTCPCTWKEGGGISRYYLEKKIYIFFFPPGTVLIYRTCWKVKKKKKNAANVKQSVTHGSLPHVLVSSKKHNVPQSAVPFCCFGPLQALALKHCRRQQLQIVRIQDLGF